MYVNKFSSNLVWKANKENEKKYIYINSWFTNLYMSYIVVIGVVPTGCRPI